jgi:hypothetical protein
MMNAAADRLEFAPPPQPGMLRAFVLAVVAHLLLLAALTWGVRWKNDTRELSAEAELWSSVPVQAAPKLVEAARHHRHRPRCNRPPHRRHRCRARPTSPWSVKSRNRLKPKRSRTSWSRQKRLQAEKGWKPRRSWS